MVNFGLTLLNAVVTVFDIVFYPINYLKDKPWRVRQERQEQRGWLTFLSSKRVLIKHRQDSSHVRDRMLKMPTTARTVVHVFNEACDRYGRRRCLGTRRVLGTAEGTFAGKPITKVIQKDDYDWLTYDQTRQKVGKISKGLALLCNTKPGDRVLIYADTKADWMVTALAIFQAGCTAVTLLSTMSEEAIQHALKQTEPHIAFTDLKSVQKLRKIVKNSRLCKLKYVVYFENDFLDPVNVLEDGLVTMPISDLETLGVDTNCACKPDDQALIMYTSGTTGMPKGAIFKHSTLVTGICATSVMAKRTVPKGYVETEAMLFIAYLPLAHIFELTQELHILSVGGQLAYSSPLTLTDNSPAIIPGDKGDMPLLRPTIMIAVPIVLQRIHSAVKRKVKAKGKTFEAFFNYWMSYKKYWTDKGFRTPLLDKIVFSKIAAATGGNLKLIISGGAPLNPSVHEDLRLCLATQVFQGYGMTETNGGCILMDLKEHSVGESGSGGSDTLLMLENWEEGGYDVRDKIGPQGEILVGGDAVADGYFKCENEEDNKAIFLDENGKKWMRTGDIGRVNVGKNTISIIDRKKQLVKLQNGEYISLGRIESSLQSHPLVELACVVANSLKSYVVVLINPNPEALANLTQSGKDLTIEQLCADPNLTEKARDILQDHLQGKFASFEIPRFITLVPEVWTPDNGFVTGAMKIRRKVIEKVYKKEIDIMYST